jgi:hypothetical protein
MHLQVPDIERDGTIGIDRLDDALQFARAARQAIHPDGHGDFQARLHHDIARVQDHFREIGRRHAIHADAGRLHPVEQHVVDRKERGRGNDRAPVAVHQEQGERDKNAKMEFGDSGRELDLQRNHRRDAQRQHDARKNRATH